MFLFPIRYTPQYGHLVTLVLLGGLAGLTIYLLLIGVLWGVSFAIRTWLPFSFYWLGLGLTVIVLGGILGAYQQFYVSYDEEQIQLRTGVFGSKLTTIPFCHVIGLETDQPLLQRKLQLQNIILRVYTDEAIEYRLKDLDKHIVGALQGRILQMRGRDAKVLPKFQKCLRNLKKSLPKP